MPGRFNHTMPSSPRKHLWTWGIIALAALVAGVVIPIVTVTANAPRAQGDEVPQSVLHAETRMGVVELKVRDLPSMTAFYGQHGVGLDLLSDADDAVSLGVDDDELIRLVPAEGEPATAQDAGLYHSAILFPDGPALAQAMVRMFVGGEAPLGITLWPVTSFPSMTTRPTLSRPFVSRRLGGRFSDGPNSGLGV